MKKIIISPFSAMKYFEPEKRNAKNYPYWQEFINLCKMNDYQVIQIGTEGEYKFQNVDEYKFNCKFSELKELIKDADYCISVDNFFQHFCWYYGKKCHVIFSRSDPDIFGHKENVNILKDKTYLRLDQFGVWKTCEFMEDAFYKAEDLFKIIFT